MKKTLTKIELIRQGRLKELVAEHGKAANFARRFNLNPKSISHWVTGTKGMSDDTARHLESLTVKPDGWMDGGDAGAPSQSRRTDRAKMATAMELLRQLAELSGTPELLHNPVAIANAYDLMAEFPPDDVNVLEMLKRLAANIRGEQGDGEGT